MNCSNRDSNSTVEGKPTGVDVTGATVDDRFDGVGVDAENAEVTQLHHGQRGVTVIYK